MHRGIIKYFSILTIYSGMLIFLKITRNEISIPDYQEEISKVIKPAIISSVLVYSRLVDNKRSVSLNLLA